MGAVEALRDTGWFEEPGAYVLVDGQFGSTGKGAMAVLLGCAGAGRVDRVTTNAGPNSGHTGFYKGEKIVTKQLPVASVVMGRMGHSHLCDLNGGAIVDPDIVKDEINKYLSLGVQFYIDPAAAVIEDCDRAGSDSTRAIASTGKGVGEALARKVVRANPGAGKVLASYSSGRPMDRLWYMGRSSTVLIETAQGFSLGANSGFYPHCTARECTVGQALADARIHPAHLRKTIMTVRTFPIRVGNTEQGYSGDCYPDQQEITWEDLGVEPEITTVTGRVRRVFTWSDMQFYEAVTVNRPDAIFLNFMNYLGDEHQRGMIKRVRSVYREVMGRDMELLLLGYGPLPSDVIVAD